MKEIFKHLKPIQNVVALALLAPLSIFTIQTSAIAQNFAPVPKTGQTESYATGDDGDLQMGVQWPESRFTDNGDGTVTDNLTGLIWLKNANCFGGKDWFEALDAGNNLADGQCGLSDGSSPGEWRLPNVRELHSLIDYSNYEPLPPSGHPFAEVQLGDYWSSTTVANRTEAACFVTMGIDIVSPYQLLDDGPKGNPGFTFVWPVRSGNEVVLITAPVPKTGQTESYATGDDGDLQMGVQWPEPRFTDNGNGTVTDNLTGLIWLKDADCFGEKNWNDALNVSNNLADGQCGLSDGSSSGEWRLPNVREFRALIDHGSYEPPLPFNHPFIEVQVGDYWSSTTVTYETDSAWFVLLGLGNNNVSFGQIWHEPKVKNYYVWPVRDMQPTNGSDGGGGSSGPCFVDTLRY
jgi:hypothetical protein